MVMSGDFLQHECIARQEGRITLQNRTGEISAWTGELKNMRILGSNRNLTVTGSLSAFASGTNLHTLSPEAIRVALEELSKALRIDVYEAKLTRVDIPIDIVVSKQVKAYMPEFGPHPNMQSSLIQRKQGVERSYVNSSGKLILYDKIAECKNNHRLIPEQYIGYNVLRVERSFNHRYLREIGPIFGQNLLDISFHTRLAERFAADYYSIVRKSSVIPIESFTPNNVHDLTSYLARLGLARLTEGELQTVIDLSAINGTSYQGRSRMKRKIFDLLQLPSIAEANNLTAEVDASINAQFEKWGVNTENIFSR